MAGEASRDDAIEARFAAMAALSAWSSATWSSGFGTAFQCMDVGRTSGVAGSGVKGGEREEEEAEVKNGPELRIYLKIPSSSSPTTPSVLSVSNHQHNLQSA